MTGVELPGAQLSEEARLPRRIFPVASGVAIVVTFGRVVYRVRRSI